MSKYCAIVKDLMWQYAEGECSPETKAFIEEHISECEDCRELFESIKKTDELVSETVTPEPLPNEKILKKGFGKIRKRFVISTLALILIVPILFCSMLLSNEIKKEGICYSNIDEIVLARKFVTLLEKGEYGKASEHLDFSRDYYDIMKAKDELGQTYYDSAVVVDKSENVYAISGYFAEILKRDGHTDWQTDFDENEFWTMLMFNYPNEVSVPERIWNKLVTESYVENVLEDNAIVPTKINGIGCGETWYFYRYETAYGAYYATFFPPIGGEAVLDAASMIGITAVINKEIYDDAREDIEKRAEEGKKNFLEYYEKELKMTLAEYNAYRREDFVNRMNIYTKRGYELDYKKVKDVYRKDGWIVEISCIESGRDDSERLTIRLRVENGKITNMDSKESTYLSTEILGRVNIEE